MKEQRTMEISFLAAVATLFALGTGNVAASGCRALDHQACTQSTSCRWIKGYQRSDGKKVSAYCRKLPSSKVEKETPRTSSKQG